MKQHLLGKILGVFMALNLMIVYAGQRKSEKRGSAAAAELSVYHKDLKPDIIDIDVHPWPEFRTLPTSFGPTASIPAKQAVRANSDSVIQAWLRSQITVPMMKGASAVDMVLDNGGNCYVTGNVFVAGNDDDIAIIAYAPNGSHLWSTLYDGPDHEADRAQQITLDGEGNVIVVGNSQSATNGNDLVVIKYDPQGKYLWHASYDGPAHGADSAVAVAVNPQGEIYLSGCSEDSGAYFNFLTIKYSADGNLIWLQRYHSSDNGHDAVRAMALAPSGQLLVSGHSQTAESRCFVTVAYSATGQLLWVSRHGGERGSFHYLVDMAVDAAGNVFVNGESHDSTGIDFTTIKYDSEGNQQWIARFPADEDDKGLYRPVGMVLDTAGGVYLAGYEESLSGSADYILVKYNTNGEQGWAKKYSAPTGVSRRPTAITIDALQNIYLTGASDEARGGASDFLTFKTDSVGDPIWLVSSEGASQAADTAAVVRVSRTGEVYIAGTGTAADGRKSWCVIKYDAQGQSLFKDLYQQSGYRLIYYGSMDLTPTGHIAVAAACYGKGSKTDYVTSLFDANGNNLWQRWYDSPRHSFDYPTDLVVGQDGHIYVTGISSDRNNDIVTIKYSPMGQEIWATRYNGPADSSDHVYALAVDSKNNVFLTGYSFRQRQGYECVTVKYNPDGEQIWSAYYDSADDSLNQGRAIAIDPTGNVYVAAQSRSNRSGSDWVILKYTSNGQMEWMKRFDGPANGNDYPIDLAMTDDGNILVAGNVSKTSFTTHYGAIKLNPQGEILWTVIPDFSGTLTSMALARSGYLYIAGSASIKPNGGDYGLVKIDQDGHIVWQQFSDGPAEVEYECNTLTADANDNIYLAGSFVNTAVGMERGMLTARYTSSGQLRWTKTATVLNTNDVYLRAIKVDSSGHVYVAGWIEYMNLPLQWTVIKYQQPETRVNESTSTAEPMNCHLYPAFPNPFNPTTVITFSLSHKMEVSLKIFNVLGREVETLVAGKLSAGTHSIQWNAQGLPGGVYFCRLQVGGSTLTRKLLFLR